MTEHYTTDRVVNIIKNYHDILKIINEVLGEKAKSVGVSQYGIEATMPKGNGTSDQTGRQALENIESVKFVSKKISDIKYINDRLDNIVNERDAIIMQMLINGKSQLEIGQFLGISQSAVNHRIEKIAEQLNGEWLGYPQTV